MRNIHIKQGLNPPMRRPVRAAKLQHPPKVKYLPVTITSTITTLISRPIHPPKVK